MRIVGSYEAKTHLSRLLDEVAGGEEITITKHGAASSRASTSTSVPLRLPRPSSLYASHSSFR